MMCTVIITITQQRQTGSGVATATVKYGVLSRNKVEMSMMTDEVVPGRKRFFVG